MDLDDLSSEDGDSVQIGEVPEPSFSGPGLSNTAAPAVLSLDDLTGSASDDDGAGDDDFVFDLPDGSMLMGGDEGATAAAVRNRSRWAPPGLQQAADGEDAEETEKSAALPPESDVRRVAPERSMTLGDSEDYSDESFESDGSFGGQGRLDPSRATVVTFGGVEMRMIPGIDDGGEPTANDILSMGNEEDVGAGDAGASDIDIEEAAARTAPSPEASHTTDCIDVRGAQSFTRDEMRSLRLHTPASLPRDGGAREGKQVVQTAARRRTSQLAMSEQLSVTIDPLPAAGTPATTALATAPLAAPTEQQPHHGNAMQVASAVLAKVEAEKAADEAISGRQQAEAASLRAEARAEELRAEVQTLRSSLAAAEARTEAHAVAAAREAEAREEAEAASEMARWKTEQLSEAEDRIAELEQRLEEQQSLNLAMKTWHEQQQQQQQQEQASKAATAAQVPLYSAPGHGSDLSPSLCRDSNQPVEYPAAPIVANVYAAQSVPPHGADTGPEPAGLDHATGRAMDAELSVLVRKSEELNELNQRLVAEHNEQVEELQTHLARLQAELTQLAAGPPSYSNSVPKQDTAPIALELQKERESHAATVKRLQAGEAELRRQKDVVSQRTAALTTTVAHLELLNTDLQSQMEVQRVQLAKVERANHLLQEKEVKAHTPDAGAQRHATASSRSETQWKLSDSSSSLPPLRSARDGAAHASAGEENASPCIYSADFAFAATDLLPQPPPLMPVTMATANDDEHRAAGDHLTNAGPVVWQQSSQQLGEELAAMRAQLQLVHDEKFRLESSLSVEIRAKESACQELASATVTIESLHETNVELEASLSRLAAAKQHQSVTDSETASAAADGENHVEAADVAAVVVADQKLKDRVSWLTWAQNNAETASLDDDDKDAVPREQATPAVESERQAAAKLGQELQAAHAQHQKLREEIAEMQKSLTAETRARESASDQLRLEVAAAAVREAQSARALADAKATVESIRQEVEAEKAAAQMFQQQSSLQMARHIASKGADGNSSPTTAGETTSYIACACDRVVCGGCAPTRVLAICLLACLRLTSHRLCRRLCLFVALRLKEVARLRDAEGAAEAAQSVNEQLNEDCAALRQAQAKLSARLETAVRRHSLYPSPLSRRYLCGAVGVRHHSDD
jgi:hypothetical protein